MGQFGVVPLFVYSYRTQPNSVLSQTNTLVKLLMIGDSFFFFSQVKNSCSFLLQLCLTSQIRASHFYFTRRSSHWVCSWVSPTRHLKPSGETQGILSGTTAPFTMSETASVQTSAACSTLARRWRSILPVVVFWDLLDRSY